MEKNTNNQNLIIHNDLQLLKTLEKSIARNVSPLLLDYVFILAPEQSTAINIKVMTPKTSELLISYIKAGNQLLAKLKLPQHKASPDLLADFLDMIHDMYFIRFVDAKAIYANYEFYRIPTLFELKLKEVQHNRSQEDDTYSLVVPEGLIINSQGDIDWQATMKAEQTEHKLARYLTAFKKARIMSHQMFIELQKITTKNLAYPIFRTQLEKLTQEVLSTTIFHFSKDVHLYLDKQYSLEDSIVNVYEYYSNITKGGNKVLMGELSQLFNDLTQQINTALNAISDLNSDTKAAILDDYFELIIAYIKTKQLLPTDYYQVVHRDISELHENEKGENYTDILDFKLYVPEGGVTEFAFETFVVDLSREAKFFIYQAVVGDNINPQFTLKTYLRA